MRSAGKLPAYKISVQHRLQNSSCFSRKSSYIQRLELSAGVIAAYKNITPNFISHVQYNSLRGRDIAKVAPDSGSGRHNHIDWPI